MSKSYQGIDDKIWWRQGEFRTIYASIARLIYFESDGEFLSTADNMKKLAIEMLKIDASIMEDLYSVRYPKGGMTRFHHLVLARNADLIKKGFIKRTAYVTYCKTSKWIASGYDPQADKNRINNFVKVAKLHLSSSLKIGIAQSPIFVPSKKYSYDRNRANEAIRKFRVPPDLKIKELDEEKISKLTRVKKLRVMFAEELDREFSLSNFTNTKVHVISKFEEKEFKFNFFDHAHILPVRYLANNSLWEQIADPYNGLILDPNTHRSLDGGELIFDENFDLVDRLTRSKIIRLAEEIKTEERKEYMRRFNKEFEQILRDRQNN